MMICCHEASRLSSLAMEKPLKLTEKWALKLHLAMCHNCRRFEKQINLLREMLCSCSVDTIDHSNGECLSEECKDKINAKMKKK